MYPKPIGPKRPIGNPAFRMVQSKPTTKVDPLHRIFADDAVKVAGRGELGLRASGELAEVHNLPLRKVAAAQAAWAKKHGMERWPGRVVNTAVGTYSTTYSLPSNKMNAAEGYTRSAFIQNLKKAHGL
jgi:hypothetical protein